MYYRPSPHTVIVKAEYKSRLLTNKFETACQVKRSVYLATLSILYVV